MNYLIRHIGRLLFKSNFDQLLFNNEFKMFNLKKLGLLFTIISLSIFAIGFNYQQYQALRLKMKNPFTNWLDFSLADQSNDETQKILEYFNQKESKDAFNLKNAKGYEIDFNRFTNIRSFEYEQFTFRSVESSDDIFGQIISAKGGEVYSCKKEEEVIAAYEDCAVVVTKKMLADLGYDNNWCDAKYLIAVIDRVRQYHLLIPIAAVVNFLPNNSDLVANSTLMRIMRTHLGRNEAVTTPSDKLRFLTDQEGTKPKEISDHQNTNAMRVPISSNLSLLMHEVKFSDFSLAENFKKRFLSDRIRLSRRIELLNWDCFIEEEKNAKDLHYIAFNFRDLSKIHSFRDSLLSGFDANLSLKDVEAGKNFSQVSKLALVGIFGLFLFGIISVVIYLQTLLDAHLKSESRNIGTVMAFGASRSRLTKVYNCIFILALVFCILLCFVLGFFLHLFDITVINIASYFAAGVFITFTYYFGRKTILSVLNNSPSKLIKR